MPVQDSLDDLLTRPLPEFHYSLLVTGGAGMAALARKCQEVFMAAVLTLHAGEPVMEDAAIKIAVDHLPHISTQEAALGGEALLIDPLEFLEVIFNASVIFPSSPFIFMPSFPSE
jgi:hypothetical protein